MLPFDPAKSPHDVRDPVAIVEIAKDQETGLPLHIREWMDKIAISTLGTLTDSDTAQSDAITEQGKLLTQEHPIGLTGKHITQYIQYLGKNGTNKILQGAIEVACRSRLKFEELMHMHSVVRESPQKKTPPPLPPLNPGVKILYPKKK